MTAWHLVHVGHAASHFQLSGKFSLFPVSNLVFNFHPLNFEGSNTEFSMSLFHILLVRGENFIPISIDSDTLTTTCNLISLKFLCHTNKFKGRKKSEWAYYYYSQKLENFGTLPASLAENNQ